MSGSAAGRVPSGSLKANEVGSVGGLGKKRKSTAAPASKNEARALQSARNRTGLARAGTSAAAVHPSQQRQMKLQPTSSPLRGFDKRDIARTPTAGSFTPGLKLMTTQKNSYGAGNSKSPSAAGAATVSRAARSKNSRKSSLGLKAGKPPEPKAGRQAAEDVRESLPRHGAQRSVEKLRATKVSNPYLDLRKRAGKNTASQQILGVVDKDEEIAKEDDDSAESDDTVKLEDFQEA